MKTRLTNDIGLSVCALFVLLIFSVMGVSNAPSWSINSDIKAATLTITTGSGYGGYFETTYSSAFSSTPNVGIAIPTLDIAIAPSLMLWKANLPQSTNTTHFKLSLPYVSTPFKLYKISYLAVIGTLSFLKVDYMNPAEAELGPILAGAGTRSATGFKSINIGINLNSNVSIIPYLSGLKISTTTNVRAFSLTFSKHNSSGIVWNATCYAQTTVTEFVSYMLFYDITLGEATQDLFLDYTPITATNNIRNPVNLLFFSSVNLLVGASSFHYTNGFSYNIEPTTLDLAVPTSGVILTNMTLSFWSFRKRNCIASTPYYEKLSNLCYDVCPMGFFPVNTPTRYCDSCSTYMAQCNSCTSTTVCNGCATGWAVNGTFNGCTCATGFYMNSGSCVASCPSGQFGDDVLKTCVASCTGGRYANSVSKTCVTMCPAPQFGNPSDLACVALCPAPLFGESLTRLCVALCPTNYFADSSTRTCVTTCPVGFFADTSTKTCVVALACPSGYFADNSTRACVTTCPSGLFAEDITKACVSSCLDGKLADSLSNRCVALCPIAYFGDNSTFTCVQMCPSLLGTFGQNSSRICVNSCPTATFAQNSTRVCVASCWGGLFSDPINKRCVNTCPSTPSALYGDPISLTCVPACQTGYFGYDVQRSCVTQCPEAGLYRQNSTTMCVSSCANEPNSYADDSNGYCVAMCSAGTWADPSTSKCVSQCPTGYFALAMNSMCVQVCPAPYYADSGSKNCLVSCPANSIQDDATRTCKTCSDGTWPNFVTQTCASCDQPCKTCAGASSNCTSCQTTRTLTAGQCICNSGLQDDDGNCISSCNEVGCDLCPTDKNVCQQCKPSFLLSGGRCHCPSDTFYSIADNACYSCDSKCAICSGSSSNECTGCHSAQNRQINTETFACDCKATFHAPNSEDTCIKQPSTTCPTNFEYNASSGYCVEVCGDGKLFELQCDDGNTDNGDGCDSSCKPESNFSCLYGDASSPSICSYDGQITFDLIAAEKDMFGNVIKIEYNLIPQLKFYQKFPNFTNSIKLSDPTINIADAFYSSETKSLYVNFVYNETATGKVISVSYTPASSPYSHALTSTSYDWPIRVGNGLSLTYYPENVYGQAQIYDYVTLGIYIGALFVFVLALFFRKMIGVEIVILIQTQVISLSMLNQIHPILGVLTKDKYAFGYNQFEDLMNLKSENNYENLGLYSVIGFSRIFAENVNVMFFVICVFYLLAIVIGLLSSCKQKAVAKKMKQAALILAREIAFGLLLFSLMNMITSYALQLYAGTIWQYDPEYSGTIKIGSIIIIAANYGVYAMYFKESIESYVFYEKRSKTAQLQPLFIATKAILIAAGIAMYQTFGTLALYGLIGLQGAYIILVIILRPFKRRVDMFRSIILELSLLYVIGSRYVLIEYVNLDQPKDWTTFLFLEYGLVGEHGLVAFSLLISLISLIFHLFKANKADSQISPEEAFSQFDLQDDKQKQKRSTKHSKSTNYPIQDYLENYLQEEDRKHVSNRKNKLYFEENMKNNSMAQLINFSDGQGNDSKRKLKEKSWAQSMEIIEMDD